ncbi:hypothetical protein BPOR_1052g00010 [Botrytis porri]|uniref:Major facilitator superfamily (MFS) profile domain-containing protein n=1 Tax=Botrytis porri TaxID=87229 RepID=A0A4Z1KJQ8_9HELO|nr:hypothetical protein BPOR_1052g00010 [Botrytis porri]
MATTNSPAVDGKATDDDVKLAQFGQHVSPGTHIIPAYWQSLWDAMAQVCTGFGAWGEGPMSDRSGRRVSFCVSALISIAGTAVIYIATTPGAFLGGKMVNAIGLGMALTTGPIYVSEITPLRIRGVALSAYAFSMDLRYLIAASVAFYCVTIVVEPILASMVRVTREEECQANASSETSCMDLFKGANWRRTRIILYTNGLNQMIGATTISNASYFMITAEESSRYKG